MVRGGELRPYKIKPVLFLNAVCLLTATKILHKRRREMIMLGKGEHRISAEMWV